MDSLKTLLKQRFGHKAFRPHQEEVCRAVAGGSDALLVMPTGSGKSLCYQLPGLARGGCTLVVSPLVALIEDQSARLTALGLRSVGLHAGLGAEKSKAAFAAYYTGALDYLFVSPERLGIAGFAEKLTQRMPTLIAVDEAHCISQWGHDFRPEYRLLGERLAYLQPTPIIALTATATRRVQDDILARLGIPDARRFIHGFRRTNLAIEVVECTKKLRPKAVVSLLDRPERSPAIVYAPTRQSSEDLSLELRTHGVKADAYHAGMAPRTRSDVQERFLAGQTPVITATVAFGMGVDKADVRTVVHAALPQTIENYYQEIGRAGRDGEPAKAVLFYHPSDRVLALRLHEKSYPDIEKLAQVRRAIPARGASAGELPDLVQGLQEDELQSATSQLLIHGGLVPQGDLLLPGSESAWRAPYKAQREHRVAQLDEIMRFAETPVCRMLQIVRYFGDVSDGGQTCGICDVCDPATNVLHKRRVALPDDRRVAEAIRRSLEAHDGRTVKQVFEDACPKGDVDRQDFERLLRGLEQAGLLHTEEDRFEREGREITFRRLWLHASAWQEPGDPLDKLMLDEAMSAPKGRRSLEERRDTRAKRKVAKAEMATEAPTRPAPRPPPVATAPVASAKDEGLYEALRAWRAGVAKATGQPAFMVLTDKVLAGVAKARPTRTADLWGIPGLGPKLIEKHGRAILDVVAAQGR